MQVTLSKLAINFKPYKIPPKNTLSSLVKSHIDSAFDNRSFAASQAKYRFKKFWLILIFQLKNFQNTGSVAL